MLTDETIYALATVGGKSAIATFRISGKNTRKIIKKISLIKKIETKNPKLTKIFTNKKKNEEADVGTIIFYKSPKSYISTNINGTLNGLEAARDNNVDHFVNTSTSEVYGSAQYVPIDEKHPLNAQSPYAASKIAADQLSLAYHRSFGLPVTIIRPFNTFGPRQSQRAAIPAIINQIISGKREIKLGNLNAYRDFTYVDDTVNGYIKLIGNQKSIGEVINLGTGSSFSIKETLKLICKILNKKVEVKLDQKRLRPKKSEVNKLLSKNTKAKKILKWKPKFSGKTGFFNGLKNK